MELKVGNSQFSNNGGGGGTFFMGRGDRDGQKKDRDDEPEAAPELEADAWQDSHSLHLPTRQPSRLSLWQPRPPAAVAVDEAAVAAELANALHMKLRLLNHSVGRLERDYARRLRAEIGEMLIGA